jgi:iron complex transport system ATP-binding protein
MGNMTAAITIENLYFSYADYPVLKNINLKISARKFSVILGKNGCGKSTLFKVLTGIQKFKKGNISVLGENIAKLSARQRAKKIGYLPQQHRPVFPFSVTDVVLTGRASHVALTPGKEDMIKAEAAIDRVGIGHLRNRPFTELSGGEQQMAMIARVLAQEPKVILLDEPTAHLDIFNQAKIFKLARELVNSGLTLLAILHDPNCAFIFGDEFIFLKEGRVYPLSSHQKPWDKEVLNQVYDSSLTTIDYGERAIVIPTGH